MDWWSKLTGKCITVECLFLSFPYVILKNKKNHLL